MIKEFELAVLSKPRYFYGISGFFVEFKKDNFNAGYLIGLGLNERQVDALLFFKFKGEMVTSGYLKRDIMLLTGQRDVT